MAATVKPEVATKLRKYLSRKNNVITADDIHAFVSRNGFRLNTKQRQSLIASTLREPDFYPVGYTPSLREAARGRQITMWERA